MGIDIQSQTPTIANEPLMTTLRRTQLTLKRSNCELTKLVVQAQIGSDQEILVLHTEIFQSKDYKFPSKLDREENTKASLM